jgi:DNA-binding transcriptional MerR regulator
MKIGVVARRTGLSVHTIRYYERIGLLPPASRHSSSRQRDYDATILSWLEFIGRLRTTGMPIKEMVHYAKLRERGTATAGDRRRLLETHRERVRAHLRELEACLAVLDTKIAGYAGGDSEIDDDSKRQRNSPLSARLARPLGDRR